MIKTLQTPALCFTQEFIQGFGQVGLNKSKQEASLGYLLTFNVPVDDHIAVQVEDSLQDLPGVLPRDVLGQSTVSFQLVLY